MLIQVPDALDFGPKRRFDHIQILALVNGHMNRTRPSDVQKIFHDLRKAIKLREKRHVDHGGNGSDPFRDQRSCCEPRREQIDERYLARLAQASKEQFSFADPSSSGHDDESC